MDTLFRRKIMSRKSLLKEYGEKVEGITFSLSKNIDPEQALALYKTTDWLDGNETIHTVRKMFRSSFAAVSAKDTATGKLVGFFRAISDGVGDAFLLDLLVHPSCRRRGIGEALVRLLSGFLAEKGISWILCVGIPGTEKFYEKCGGKKMEGHSSYRFPGCGE